MDFSMFLVFPGILITIGVGLLVLSIIIVIIAYKTADKLEPNNLNQASYDKNLEIENNDNFNVNINNVRNENDINNRIEDKPSEEIENNNLKAEEEVSKNINNNPENNLENTKTFNFPGIEPPKEEIITKEEFPKIEITKQEEKIDAFEKEFENTEEKQAEVYPKIENIRIETPILKDIKQSKIEEDEEEIEIL